MNNLKYTLLIAGVASVYVTESVAKSESKRPNIILIYADDMGYGDIGCYNPNSKIPTPNIDELAKTSISFSDGHSSSGLSSPSRYGILTGNYHWRRRHNILESFEKSAFKPNEMTLPRMLSQQGYYTALVGKWHLGFNWYENLTDKGKSHLKEMRSKRQRIEYACEDYDWSKPFSGGPCDQGFDYYFGDDVINFPPFAWIENRNLTAIPTEIIVKNSLKVPEAGPELRTGPAVKGWDFSAVLPTITNKMIEVINNSAPKKEPFFLMCTLTAPHVPILPNEEFQGKSQAGAYGDFVVQCDNIVGRVRDAIKENGIEDNTIVIFTSDNGPCGYCFARLERFEHNSSEGLRGVKKDSWEGGHRVPFMIHWDGHIKPRLSDEVVCQVDLMATIASIVDYKLPNNVAVDSYDLAPVLVGKRLKSPLREATVHNTIKNRFAIRQGDWKYFDSYSGTHTPEPEKYTSRYGFSEFAPSERSCLLYNIKKDKMEQHDVSQQHPKRVAEMQALLTKYRESGRSIPDRK